MSNDNQPLNYERTVQLLNEQTARKAYEPFPKWLYHPDGRSQLVNDEAGQSALGGEWLASPQEALDEKARRDKRDSDAFIAKSNAEAKAATQKKG